MSYVHSISVGLSFDVTVQATLDALAGQGVGVIAATARSAATRAHR